MYQLDPIQDPRWNELVHRHPSASVFHTSEWMNALRRTYKYEPIVFTASPPNRELAEGVAACRVESWLTGRRLVSLPFSDHCEPLVDGMGAFESLLNCLKKATQNTYYKYIEFRPTQPSLFGECGFGQSNLYVLHTIDLRPASADIFGAFHKDCVQRKIQRAYREGLTYEAGHSTALLRKFYELQVIARHRLKLPPQPFCWFYNLASCMGSKLRVYVASKSETPVASIMTIRFRQTLVYKYGCSDKRFSNLGGMQLLFWKAIQQAKEDGITEFDLGRSDVDNAGLIQFKDRFGATQRPLRYWRYSPVSAGRAPEWKMTFAKTVASHLPDRWLTAAGGLFYRHVA